MKFDPRKPAAEGCEHDGGFAARVAFYSDLSITNQKVGEPENSGSTVEAFVNTAQKLAKNYRPSGIFVKAAAKTGPSEKA